MLIVTLHYNPAMDEEVLMVSERTGVGETTAVYEPGAGDGYVTGRVVPKGEPRKPLLRIPRPFAIELFKALAQALHDRGYRVEENHGVLMALGDSVTDARGTRDRLLALVERLSDGT